MQKDDRNPAWKKRRYPFPWFQYKNVLPPNSILQLDVTRLSSTAHSDRNHRDMLVNICDTALSISLLIVIEVLRGYQDAETQPKRVPLFDPFILMLLVMTTKTYLQQIFINLGVFCTFEFSQLHNAEDFIVRKLVADCKYIRSWISCTSPGIRWRAL